MSTCKSLDLELMKRKRIEAIRGQILSKLRLPKEPEIDQEGDTEKVPASLMSIYNSTVELSEEQVHTCIPPTQDTEEEAYFAKEVHKFNMKQSEYTQRTTLARITTLSLFLKCFIRLENTLGLIIDHSSIENPSISFIYAYGLVCAWGQCLAGSFTCFSLLAQATRFLVKM